MTQEKAVLFKLYLARKSGLFILDIHKKSTTLFIKHYWIHTLIAPSFLAFNRRIYNYEEDTFENFFLLPIFSYVSSTWRKAVSSYNHCAKYMAHNIAYGKWIELTRQTTNKTTLGLENPVYQGITVRERRENRQQINVSEVQFHFILSGKNKNRMRKQNRSQNIIWKLFTWEIKPHGVQRQSHYHGDCITNTRLAKCLNAGVFGAAGAVVAPDYQYLITIQNVWSQA